MRKRWLALILSTVASAYSIGNELYPKKGLFESDFWYHAYYRDKRLLQGYDHFHRWCQFITLPSFEKPSIIFVIKTPDDKSMEIVFREMEFNVWYKMHEALDERGLDVTLSNRIKVLEELNIGVKEKKKKILLADIQLLLSECDRVASLPYAKPSSRGYFDGTTTHFLHLVDGSYKSGTLAKTEKSSLLTLKRKLEEIINSP